LKTAVAGIHGAGEALRGTISQNADRRIRHSKASDVEIAKHQDVINKGRYEVENGRFAPRNSNVRKPVAEAAHGHYALNDRQYSQHNQQAQTPEPDARPTHLNLSYGPRFSTGNTRPQNVEAEQTQEMEKDNTGRIGKWLHKAMSHPSDKKQGEEMAKGGKLQRRSVGALGPVQE